MRAKTENCGPESMNWGEEQHVSRRANGFSLLHRMAAMVYDLYGGTKEPY